MSKRQDFSRERTTENGDKIRLGDYTLGQTLGEGEFGKVKIGWKKSSSAQVAVKIIRREKLDTAGRLAKVHREISILKQLNHPNIVALHEMVETRHTIGIILEYASGGELFDYILQQRYLKDDKARRLFAQLVSGVGYLHRNGIIHRDLKLENLLLDSNKNIIITDFGFANTFDPTGGEDSGEYDYDYRDSKPRKAVNSDGYDQINTEGYRQNDMMSTSCGSPCYAAPELVVSDGLYSGRKVDVWSCGVILYAMLAGYLPFDDDPDNPEGDNINLLYKYICSTPLIFPDYVTPHARDILKRILVPDPKKRADLFEVARHSWLSDYADLVEAITSNVKLSPEEYRRTKALQIPIHEFTYTPGQLEAGRLARANSERFIYKPRQIPENMSGTPPKAKGAEEKEERPAESPRDQKRRTVQVEYVAPRSTKREDPVAMPQGKATDHVLTEKALNAAAKPSAKGQVANGDAGFMPPAKDLPPASLGENRTRRNVPRSTSDQPAHRHPSSQDPSLFPDRTQMGPSRGEPTRPRYERLPPSRGSYGQPASAEVQKTSAHGQISRPTSKALPTTPKERTPSGHLIMPPSVESPNQSQKPTRGHKRASTLSGISEKFLSRANSIGRRGPKTQAPKTDRTHPPTSMRHDYENGTPTRTSGESSRRSFGFSRKSSDITTPKQEKRQSRRFSLLPRSKGSEQAAAQAAHSFNNPPLPAQTPNGQNGLDGRIDVPQPPQNPEKVLPGKHKRFNDAYDAKNGSSGASRRVMDFFRRRR